MELLVENYNSDSSKEFNLEWDKHLSYLTLNKVKTKVTIDNSNILIEKKSHILGLFSGSTKRQKLPLGNISRLAVKKKINLFDLILGITMIAVGYAQPLFFILGIIIFWTGFSTKLVITTTFNTKVIIPSDSKESAKSVIEAINEIPVK
jgi:hypothetical protein